MLQANWGVIPVLKLDLSFFEKADALLYAENDLIFDLLNKISVTCNSLQQCVQSRKQLLEHTLTRNTSFFETYTLAEKAFSKIWSATCGLAAQFTPALFDSFYSIKLTDPYLQGLFQDEMTFEIENESLFISVTIPGNSTQLSTSRSWPNTCNINQDVLLQYGATQTKKIKMTINCFVCIIAGKIHLLKTGFPSFLDAEGHSYDPFREIPAHTRSRSRAAFTRSIDQQMGDSGIEIPAVENTSFPLHFVPIYYTMQENKFYVLSRYSGQIVKRDLAISNPLGNGLGITLFIARDLFRTLTIEYINKRLDAYQRITRMDIETDSGYCGLKTTVNHYEERTVFLVWDAEINVNLSFWFQLKLIHYSEGYILLKGIQTYWSANYSLEDIPSWKMDEAKSEVKRMIYEKIDEYKELDVPFDLSDYGFSMSRARFIPEGFTLNFKK